MGLVQHIGHWPWADETGTGPLAVNDFYPPFGSGSGTVISNTAVPYFPNATYPLAYPTKEQAMWWFWRVQTWSLTIASPTGYFNGTQELLIRPAPSPYATFGVFGTEEPLVCCRDGLQYSVERIIDDIHYNAYLYIGWPDIVGDAQCYYNPATNRWLPKIRILINYFKTEDPEDAIQVGTDGSPNPYTATLNGESVNLQGSGDPTLIQFTPTEYWSHGGTWNTLTGVPV